MSEETETLIDYGVTATGGVMINDNRALLEMEKLCTSMSAGEGLLISREEKSELIDIIHKYFIRSGPIMELEIPKRSD